jgi:hypothetical protein
VVITRETAYLSSGPNLYIAEQLQSLGQSTNFGPLASFAVGKYLLKNGLAGADNFARLGLERLDQAAFEREVEFLRSSPLFEPLLKSVRSAFAKLERSEQKSAREAVPFGLGSTLFPAADLPAETNIVAKLWESAFKPGLERRLTSLVDEAEDALPADAAFARADEAYRQQNLPVAIKWLKRASAKGHAQSTAALGELYENGRGVDRDIKMALSYYEKAARSGLVDAQVRLGNILSDAFSDVQDFPRAFVWYSVAERYGHKLAQAMKLGVERKLSPEQVAAAQPEYFEILRDLQTPK